MIGMRVGNVVVTTLLEKIVGEPARVECTCDCGTVFRPLLWNVRKEGTKSCGCARKQTLRKINRTHGGSDSAEYRAWLAMRQRCLNPNAEKYNYYGGRGIKIDDTWASFESFLKDMGPRPNGSSLDRIDPNGNYGPQNCRWVSVVEQQNNKRNNVKYPFEGETLGLPEISRRLGIPFSCLYYRLHVKGMSIAEAIKSPSRIKNKRKRPLAA